jgi:hypothetical protein
VRLVVSFGGMSVNHSQDVITTSYAQNCGRRCVVLNRIKYKNHPLNFELIT